MSSTDRFVFTPAVFLRDASASATLGNFARVPCWILSRTGASPRFRVALRYWSPSWVSCTGSSKVDYAFKAKSNIDGRKFRNDATEPSSLRAWFQLSNFGLRDTPASADFVSQQFFSLDHFSYCVGRQIQQFSGLAWSQQRHVDWVLHSQPSSIAPCLLRDETVGKN